MSEDTDFSQWLENMNVTSETAHTLALLRLAYCAAPVASKSWVESRTIKVNAVIMALSGILAIPAISALIPFEWQPYVLGITLVANIYLRFVTSTEITTALPNQPDKIG